MLTALAACSGSSKKFSDPSTSSKSSSSTTSSTSTASSTTTPATVPDDAADRAVAESLLLVQSDFPTGWTANVAEDDPQDAVTAKKLADCAGASDPAKATAAVDSPNFDQGDAEVSVSVSVAPTRADFEKDVAALKGPKYIACLTDLFGDELETEIQKDAPGATIDDVNLVRASMPAVGDVSTAMKGTVTVSVNGRTLMMYLSDYSYGEGRSEVDLTFFNIGAPFDPALEQSLLAKAIAKLKAAV